MCKRCVLRPLPQPSPEFRLPPPGTVTVVRARHGGLVDVGALAGSLDAVGVLRDATWVRLHRLDRTVAYVVRAADEANPDSGRRAAATWVESFACPSEGATRVVGAMPDGGLLVIEDPIGRLGPEPLLDLVRSVAALGQARGQRAILVGHGNVPWAVRPYVDAIVAGPAAPRPPLPRPLGRRFSELDESAHRGLALACETGYWRPDDAAVVLAGPAIDALLPLEQGWFALRAGWSDTVRRALERLERRAAPPYVREPLALPPAVSLAPVPPVAPVPPAVPLAPFAPLTPVAPLDAPHSWRSPVNRVPALVTSATVDPALHGEPRIPDDLPADGRLVVRMLGRFEVSCADTVIEWQGQRGPAVLRYLLTQPGRSVPRDVLLEQFWPDVDPLHARNRLQVALSCLRRNLRPVTALAVVEHRAGTYTISPELDLDVDVEEFDRCRRAARRAEDHGQHGAVIAGYQRAADLYRGPFLADTPYDDWTIVPREAYRIAYLDVLDRLAGALEHAGRMDECVNVALQMLEVDGCHEAGHRLLMRSYVHMGRGHQALRQFELCRRALRSTLAVGPSTQTIGVYREVRAAMADSG